jgi:hypothetical protein
MSLRIKIQTTDCLNSKTLSSNLFCTYKEWRISSSPLVEEEDTPVVAHQSAVKERDRLVKDEATAENPTIVNAHFRGFKIYR